VPGNNIKKRNTPNQANYFNAGFAVTQVITPSASQNYLTDVGAFSRSASYYGTFDQAGNVYEWNAAQGSGSQASLRGAYWVSNAADTSYLDAYFLPPEYESSGSGFRLASRQVSTTSNKHAAPGVDDLIGPLSSTRNRSLSGNDALINASDSQLRQRTARAPGPFSLPAARPARAEAFASIPVEPMLLADDHNGFVNQAHLALLNHGMLTAASLLSSPWHR
jgi:hypothetical protein